MNNIPWISHCAICQSDKSEVSKHFLLNSMCLLIVIEIKEMQISSIFDKCSMLEQTQSQPNHTSKTKVYFNEFVANALRDNIGSKKNQPLTSEKKMRPFFSF